MGMGEGDNAEKDKREGMKVKVGVRQNDKGKEGGGEKTIEQ